MRKYKTAPKQAVALSSLVDKYNCKIGAEIGVFWGETFFYLADRFPYLELYGVDLWEPVLWGDKEDDGHRTYEEFPLNEYYDEVCQKAARYSRLHIIKGDSVKTASLFENGFLDFVFIDGDHTYEGVKADIEAWSPKTSKIISGHDIHMEGVRKAVTEKFGTYSELDNYVWYINL